MIYLLEAQGLDPWLVNAKDVKHRPGRPKTDNLDAVWLAKVAERQMIRPSFVPPPEIRRLRDLTRYRVDLIDRFGTARGLAPPAQMIKCPSQFPSQFRTVQPVAGASRMSLTSIGATPDTMGTDYLRSEKR